MPQDLGHPAEPALGMAVGDRQLPRVEPRGDDLGEVLADRAAVGDAGLEEQALADRMHRDLEHPREPVAFPGKEREVVVAELEVGRVQVAEVFQGVVEADAPPAVRRGEAASARCRSSGRMRWARSRLTPIGLRVAVDVVEVPVRLGVVVPSGPAGPTGDGHRRGC